MVDYRENGRKVDPSLFVFDVESSFSLDVINIGQTCPRDFPSKLAHLVEKYAKERGEEKISLTISTGRLCCRTVPRFQQAHVGQTADLSRQD